MESFLSQIKLLSKKLARLKDYLNELQKYNNLKRKKALNEEEEDKINGRIHAINELFRTESKKIRNELNYIEEENKTIENKENLVYETRLLQWRGLSKLLFEILKDYRNEQLSSSKEEQKKIEKEFYIAHPKATEDDFEKYFTQHKGKIFQTSSIKSKLIDRIEKRQAMMRQIAKNAVEVAQLIEESHNLIFAQADLVEKIEVNIETAKKSTEKGVENLESALAAQRRANTIKRWIASIAGFILFILIVYVGIKIVLKEN